MYSVPSDSYASNGYSTSIESVWYLDIDDEMVPFVPTSASFVIVNCLVVTSYVKVPPSFVRVTLIGS